MIPITQSPTVRIGLNVLLLLAGVVALRLGVSVIVPMLIALILATVLGPAAVWMYNTGFMHLTATAIGMLGKAATRSQRTLNIQWVLACMSVMVGLILVNLLIGAVFSLSITRLVSRLSDPDQFLQTYNDFRTKLENVSPVEIDETLLPKDATKVSQIGVFKYLNDAAPDILRAVTRYSVDWSWEAIVILFITFFVLLEGEMLARRAVAIFGPSDEVQSKAKEVLIEMAKQVRTYLVWRTLINLILAIVMGSVYQSCSLTQAWTWAVLLAILNYIPYFGPVLASIPPFLDAFIFAGPVEAVIVTALFWVIVVLEGYLVVPLVMGHSMDLNATTVMLACLFWELVWGTTGLFLAMPIMAGVKAILHNVPELRVWADLMSSRKDPDPPPRPLPVDDTLVPPSAADFANGKPGTPHADGVKTTDGDARAV